MPAICLVIALFVGFGGWIGTDSLSRATNNDWWGLLYLPIMVLVVAILMIGYKLAGKSDNQVSRR